MRSLQNNPFSSVVVHGFTLYQNPHSSKTFYLLQAPIVCKMSLPSYHQLIIFFSITFCADGFVVPRPFSLTRFLASLLYTDICRDCHFSTVHSYPILPVTVPVCAFHFLISLIFRMHSIPNKLHYNYFSES